MQVNVYLKKIGLTLIRAEWVSLFYYYYQVGKEK